MYAPLRTMTTVPARPLSSPCARGPLPSPHMRNSLPRQQNRDGFFVILRFRQRSIDSTAKEYADRGEFDRAIAGLFPTPVALAMANEELASAVVGVMNEMMTDGSYAALLDEFGILKNTEPFTVRGPSN